MEEFVRGRPKRRELVAVVGVGGNKAVNEEGSGMETEGGAQAAVYIAHMEIYRLGDVIDVRIK